MSGGIKLHRKIRDHWLYQERRQFSRFEAWIDLLMRANYTPNKILLGNELIDVDRGQFVTSIRKLIDAWNWSNTKVYAFLDLLQGDGMIEYISDTKKTVITIVNYSFYHNSEDEETTQKRNENETKAKRKHTEKKDKEYIKKDKESNKDIVENKFSPESPEYKLTELLVRKMLENNPNAKVPITEKQKERWIDAMEKIHRLDNYTHKQIQDCIVFSQSDDFWKSNVLSTSKLREQMPKLILQSQRPQLIKKSQYENTKSKLQQMLEEELTNEQG